MKRVSIFFLFLLALTGWAVTPEEFEEHKKYAEEGNVAAQYNLGTIYAHGKGVPQDYVEAIKWYRKAAAQGNIESQKAKRHIVQPCPDKFLSNC